MELLTIHIIGLYAVYGKYSSNFKNQRLATLYNFQTLLLLITKLYYIYLRFQYIIRWFLSTNFFKFRLFLQANQSKYNNGILRSKQSLPVELICMHFIIILQLLKYLRIFVSFLIASCASFLSKTSGSISLNCRTFKKYHQVNQLSLTLS